jgi:predicted nucleic acid-binding protein
MIVYFDTSALIKRYVEEDGSDQVDELFTPESTIITSVVTFAEMSAAFSRKFREGLLTRTGYLKTLSELKNEHSQLVLVAISMELNQIIENLLLKHALRGFDAIHLASAILIKQKSRFDLHFACFDRTLNKMAAAEGLSLPF